MRAGLTLLLVVVVLMFWMMGASVLMYGTQGNLGGVVRAWLLAAVFGVFVLILDDLILDDLREAKR